MTDGFTDPHTGVLINKLNITDEDKLAEVEGNRFHFRLLEVLAGHVEVAPHNAQGLQELHRHLFQDVYQWAGETRAWGEFQATKSTSADKEGPGMYTMYFGSYQQLPAHLDAIGQQLAAERFLKGLDKDQFVARAAYYFDQYNYAHAFREGNGRTLGAAFQVLAENAGYDVNLVAQSHPKQYNQARDYAILRPAGNPETDLQPLRTFFGQITTPLPELVLAPAAPVAVSDFLQRVDAMREVQQSQEPIWRALLGGRHTAVARQIMQGTRGVVHPDAQQPARLAILKTGAELLEQMPAKMEDARLRQRVARLLKALPLVTVVLLIVGPPLKAAPSTGLEQPKVPVASKDEPLQKVPELKRRGPKL
ncbi:Fic/DOC family protein [Hymenobacter properus]|uniref:protein adenylyltransferase n=1 Tax=Hymenobacter properus TaxID=2791026 RepID=A0A931BIM7_9BACT|nr:Fic family protein [Hymenobacter properus]MBF9144334.1 Fic family protein [Hymenobacter properus]MBR7723152.1 Fic family protein [Microvirga sp. SRT04]